MKRLLQKMGSIFDLEQTNRALSLGENNYRYLFENNPFPMWIYDLKLVLRDGPARQRNRRPHPARD